MTDQPSEAGEFGSAWNTYVERARAAGQEWPGDDWGDSALWDAWFERLLGAQGVANWERAVEVGQGTGKYTARALVAGCQQILACDVAAKFLELCAERHRGFVDEGRLHFAQLGEGDPRALDTAIEAHGWTGSCDAIFAIDTFVHLTFTQIAAYMRAGTKALKPGGIFAFSFAEGTTDAGFQKLVDDIDRTIAARGNASTGCFHWVTGALVRSTAEKMGYEVVLCDVDPMHGRDGHFVGRLKQP